MREVVVLPPNLTEVGGGGLPPRRLCDSRPPRRRRPSTPTYGDDVAPTWRRDRTTTRLVDGRVTGASQADASTTDAEKRFQLLYNVRSGRLSAAQSTIAARRSKWPARREKRALPSWRETTRQRRTSSGVWSRPPGAIFRSLTSGPGWSIANRRRLAGRRDPAAPRPRTGQPCIDDAGVVGSRSSRIDYF